MRCRTAAAVLVTVALTCAPLAGCSGGPSKVASSTPSAGASGDVPGASAAPSTTTPASTPAPSPLTPATSPAGPTVMFTTHHVQVNVKITCADADGVSATYTVPYLAWPHRYSVCHAEPTSSVLSDGQRRAVTVAYGTGGDGPSEVAALQALCAESGPQVFSRNAFGGVPGADLARRLLALLMLCELHPDGMVMSMLSAAAADNGAAAAPDGTFGTGLFRVGTGVAPGLYLATNVRDCYWVAMDSVGRILVNGWTRASARLFAVVSPGDHAFFSAGDCGRWRPVSSVRAT